MLSVVVLFYVVSTLGSFSRKNCSLPRIKQISLGMLHEHLRLATQQNISQPQYD